MSWRVAKSLEELLAEINAAAPTRSKASDGSIGDPAHSSRLSDHNPNPAGVVRARDFTHDPDHGLDAGELAEAVRRLGIAGHPALGPGAYVIWNHRIASATQDGQPWDWEPYGGDNPHTKHVHVSVATAARGYDSTRRWGVMEEEEIMATKAELAELLDAKLAPVLRKLDRQRDVNRGRYERLRKDLDEIATDTDADAEAIKRRVARVAAEVAALSAGDDQ